jgi:hypothetical protein
MTAKKRTTRKKAARKTTPDTTPTEVLADVQLEPAELLVAKQAVQNLPLALSDPKHRAAITFLQKLAVAEANAAQEFTKLTQAKRPQDEKEKPA